MPSTPPGTARRFTARARLVMEAVWPVRRLLPGGGWRRLLRLPGVLEPPEQALADPELLRLHLATNLGVGVLGAAALLRWHPRASEWRRGLGEGLARYDLPSWPEPFWVEVGAEGAAGGWGPPPRDFSVRLRFADDAQALAAQRGRLDVLAAIGGGALAVEGRLTLADGLDPVMATVQALLEGS